MGFGVILGVGAKTFGGKLHPSSELRVFRHLWSRSDAPCRRKFGQVWGSPAPLPEVAGNLQSRKAPLWTFDYLPHGKIVIILRRNPWAVGWSPEGMF